ncbi:metallophosphoesterase [Burkholderia pseudomallei MSHR1043]|nr:metallophosphoesterase [Burkholderia pseudomallei MSHR1043]
MKLSRRQHPGGAHARRQDEWGYRGDRAATRGIRRETCGAAVRCRPSGTTPHGCREEGKAWGARRRKTPRRRMPPANRRRHSTTGRWGTRARGRDGRRPGHRADGRRRPPRRRACRGRFRPTLAAKHGRARRRRRRARDRNSSRRPPASEPEGSEPAAR